MLLYEKYRPAKLADVIGHDAVKAQLQRYIDRNSLSGAVYWISGKSGPTLFIPQWVYIINEAHGLRSSIIQRYTTWIFTTTRLGEKRLFDDEIEEVPFTSRVRKLRLSDQGLCPLIARRAAEIADLEGLNGRPLADYDKLVKRSNNSFRAVLTAIEDGEMLP